MKHFMQCCSIGTCPVCNEVMDKVKYIFPVNKDENNEPVEK